MEDVTMKKCFICFTTTEKNNCKTFDQSDKVLHNSLNLLPTTLTSKCFKSSRKNKYYVNICKKCLHQANALTQLQERQTQLAEKLTNVQKEISDSKISFAVSVLRRRIKENRGVTNTKLAKPKTELETPLLPEMFLEPTAKIKIERIDGIQTADGSDYSNPNNPTVETDVLWGLTPILSPIQDLQLVSYHGQVDNVIQMPLLHYPYERDTAAMQECMAEEPDVVNHDSTEHQVKKEKVDDVHDFSCGENQEDNLSVGVSVAENESKVISPKVEPNEVTVEPVVSAKAPRSTDLNKGSPSHNAGSVKSKNIEPATVQSKEVASRPSHSDKVIPGRASFKCNFCEIYFTSLNELQRHEEMHIDTVSHCLWGFKNQHNFPKYKINTEPTNSGVQFDLNKVCVSKPRDPDEVISKTFKCGDDCNKEFSSPKSLLAHKRVHIDKHMQNCNTGADALRQPLDFTHLGKGIKCSFCNRDYKGLTDFQLHLCFS